MPDQTTPDAPAQAPASVEDKLRLAKAATRHLLNAICDDPRKYWLLGNGTGSWEKLTEAHAILFDLDVEKVRSNFGPRPAAYRQYQQEKEADERLLEYCREKGITGKEEE